MLNRAFLYGDGLFETIRVSEGRALHLPDHFARLSRGLDSLQLQEAAAPLTYQDFDQLIKGCIAQQATANLRIRSTFFRAMGGRYTPSQEAFDYHLEATPLEQATYPKQSSTLAVGIAQTVRLSIDSLSNLKTISALPYVKAGLEKKNKGWGDALLLNQQGYVAEAIAANIFLKIGTTLYTPALDQGCVAGIMRQQVLQLARYLGNKCVETAVPVEWLYQADELWLTNALQGIMGITHWIEGDKNYKNDTAQLWQQHLNAITKNDIIK